MACGNDPSDKSTGGGGGCDTCEQLTTIANLLASIDNKLPNDSDSGGSSSSPTSTRSNQENIDNLVSYGVSSDTIRSSSKKPSDVRDKTEERLAELRRTLGADTVKRQDENYFRTLGAREQNNLISKYNRLGTNAGAIADRMSGLSGGDASLTSKLMSSASMLNPQQQILMAEGKGGYKEFSQAVDKFKSGVIDYKQLGVELNKIPQKLNRQSQLPNIGGTILGGTIASLGAAAAISQGYLENPNQSGMGAASRYTGSYSTAGAVVGGLLGAAGAGLSLTGIGTPLGIGLMAAGGAIGSLAGSAIGIGDNTGNALDKMGIGRDLAYTVGKDPTQAIQSNIQARMFTAENTALTRSNLQGLRDVSMQGNALGTFNMDDASRMPALQTIMLANRMPLGAGEGAIAMQENAKLGFSLGQYSSAISNFMQAPSVIGGERDVFALGSQYLAQENNPLARRGMVSYENMGKVDQMTTDAISQAFFGTDVEGLGKMSKDDILSMANKSVGGMSMLNSMLGSMGGAGQIIWDTASGVVTGKGDEATKSDEEFIKALKDLTNAILDNTKKAKSKKVIASEDLPDTFYGRQAAGMINASRGAYGN